MARRIPTELRDYFVSKYVWQRLNTYNRNYLGAFVGDTGSGKSLSAISWACALDVDNEGNTRFDVDRIVFDSEDFLELVRGVKKKLRKGSFIVYDETGVDINARRFFDKQNMIMSYTTQTFRFKNYGVLYTVPNIGYIDKQVRKLFHAMIFMEGANPSENLAYGRYYSLVSKAAITGNKDIITVYPRKETDTEFELWTRFAFPRPPKEIEKAYEEKKKAVMESRYEKYQGKLSAFGEEV
jgi:hypothetical protein